MEESSRNERFDAIHEQNNMELKVVYGAFSKMTARVNGKSIEDLNLDQ
jgi:hypothetical protein